MHIDNDQPFIDSRAFNKANTAYVLFPSQADAMLASLQLFHDVPCRIMDLIFSVVTHPDFDSRQVTLRKSIDVIDVVEESRLKDRMAVVHDRSVGGDGRVVQAGFPHFILDEVLDIIHAERIDSIKSQFEETSDERTMYCESTPIEEDKTLKAMTIVHRSWTTLAQKALGRILHIGRPTNEMNTLLSPVRKSIFGPWTDVVAVQFYQLKIDETDEDNHEPSTYTLDNDGDWLENLHQILLGFTNLKCLYFKSYVALFTKWSNLTFGMMVRRNVRLEEVTIYAVDDETFNLDPLIETTTVLQNLRTLNMEGALISDVAIGNAIQSPGFACLNNVTIRRFFASPENDLRLLSILSSQTKSRLESLRIIDNYIRRKTFAEDVARAFTPSQCAAVFERLRVLHIDGYESADQWFKWIGPYCSSLESLNIIERSFRRKSFDEDVARAFTSSQCTAISAQLRSLHIDSNDSADLWFKLIGPYCICLDSLSIIGGSNMRETFGEDIARAFTPSQNVAIFGQLSSLHIDNELSADQWFKWIGPYCSSLKSLSIRDRTNLKRRAFEENVRRVSSSPQSAIVFNRLRTLRIDSKAVADLWLEWIGPSFSSLQFVTLGLSVSLKHDTLNLIPTTIQSLDLSLWTEWDTALDEITGWLKWLLNIASSKKFSMLKSFALFISKDQLNHMESQYYCREDMQRLRTEMQVFREEMNTICEGAGVKCYFNL